jgi:hypothetical protein
MAQFYSPINTPHTKYPCRTLRQDAGSFGLAGLLLLTCLALSNPALAEFSHSVTADTSLKSWQWADANASITFNQRVPDQARAFFQARGFSSEASESIAQNCFFQIIIRNPASNSKEMTLDLAQWRVIEKDGATHPPRLEKDWQQQWQEMGVKKAALIAFRWALFPSRQTFQPGDWNMGLITMGVAPGKRFDLIVTWKEQDSPREIHFTNMRCGPDRSL